MDGPRILTINAGSSSLKATLYDVEGGERTTPVSRTERTMHAPQTERMTRALQAERIGPSGGRMLIVDGRGATLLDREEPLPDHQSALRAFLGWLRREGLDVAPSAVGHRIVHGGGAHQEPELVTASVLVDLQRLVPLDPEHLPQALAVIQATARLYPAIPQVVCFDTAFHRSMPRVARIYPLPRAAGEAGVMRYGFHGLSCEYIVEALRAMDTRAADGRVIVAHLGNGASLTAVRGGASVETTMGCTPAGGLMMGTRPGDLDPGVLLHLLQAQGMSPAALNQLVNREAGLLGVSGTSADMRDLLDRESTDPRAAEAVALFCYLARKALGALVTVLGGLDTLVFTAGIGEHAAPVRERICAGLAFLGIELDPERNRRHAPIVSREGGSVVVRVMKTDEDLMIARHVRRLVAEPGRAPHASGHVQS